MARDRFHIVVIRNGGAHDWIVDNAKHSRYYAAIARISITAK